MATAIFNEIHFENLTISGRIERLIANNSIFDGMTANSVMLERCIFFNCSMKEIDISNSQLKEVTFVSSDLSLSNLDGMVIDKALFQEMDLSERDLSGVRMFGAQMIGCNLSGVNFTDAILEKCSFIKANLATLEISIFNKKSEFCL